MDLEVEIVEKDRTLAVSILEPFASLIACEKVLVQRATHLFHREGEEHM